MTFLVWAAAIFFLLLLTCLFMPTGKSKKHKETRRCPRTHADATIKGKLKFDGKCYEVFTCTEACGKSLQKLAESSNEAFAEKYKIEQASKNGVAGMHLSHHINQQHAQFAVEVPC